MKIFVVNQGSSSLKCAYYEFESSPGSLHAPIWEGSSLDFLDQQKVDVIGHRVVHGGSYFDKPVLITADVKEKIRELGEFAPLHNLPALEIIEKLELGYPNTPQIAVFDTAFHHSLPQTAQIYPGPYEWYQLGIRRYGFHGISYQYCSKRVAEILKRDLNGLRVLMCHLGSGASLCALKDGKSVDTTMGFTPLDGLMMDTRPGSLDPGIILYLLKSKSSEEIARVLYDESGLLGVSGISGDMRDILSAHAKGDPRATLVLDVYVHRLNAQIGSMVAALGGLDVLVFTGGIGENAALVRERVCDAFSFLDFKVLVVLAQEAFEIARACFEIFSQLSDQD